MGMFDALLGKGGDNSQLKGLRLSLLLAKFVKHQKDTENDEQSWRALVTDEVTGTFSTVFNEEITVEHVKAGLSMTISMFASLYYYYANGMVSRQQMVHLLDGEENFRILESTISGMGRECLGLLQEIDRLGVD